MESRIVLNAHGLIVNHIVVDEHTPADLLLDPGLTISEILTAPLDVPVLDENGAPTGEIQTVIVPMAIGGTYINGVYTPPNQ